MVTKRDLCGNQLADELAKQAVDYHRVGEADVKLWIEELMKAECRARWVGIATHEANNFEQFPYKDSEAARWRADAAKRKKLEAKKGLDGRRRRAEKGKRPELLPHQGGHDLCKVASGKGWFCLVCKARTATRQKLAVLRCDGTSGKKWAEPTSRQGPREDTLRTKIGPDRMVWYLWCVCGDQNWWACRQLQRPTFPADRIWPQQPQSAQ